MSPANLIPSLGLGTMGLDGDAGVETVTTALDLGYRHLDTAQIYENEAVVGEGLRDALARGLVDRDEVLVATKVWVDNLSSERFRDSVETSRERLGVDTIDLLYLHRPRGPYEPETTLPRFDALCDDGLVDHVGVSNFTVDQLDEARDHLDAPIVAHQTEYHPLFRRPALLEDAREHGYAVVAYSPLAGGRVFDLDPVTAVADARGVSPAAVSIAWLRAKGLAVIPKASSPEHLRANLAAADLALDDREVARIDAIEAEVELYPE
ncbi:aldo/keto reductase [Salinigranum halophilum]|uniref:aldo/keto reductase n=1 Tax=Salinigranum halophilum TaxID=2565931 RepID=UPI0010A87855|nr:aldo/keto reductase [Salinigranum halophilum]